MIKTTTLTSSRKPSLAAPPQEEKKLNRKAKEFGPSDLTIQNILNYSKALQVLQPSQSEIVFGVMN